MGSVGGKWCSMDVRFGQRSLILQKSMVKPLSRSLAWVELLLLTSASTLAPKLDADGSPEIVCASRCQVMGPMVCLVLVIKFLGVAVHKKHKRRCEGWRKAEECEDILGEIERIERKESGFLEEV